MLKKSKKQAFIIACIGCVEVIGDRLGPLVGDLLIARGINTFVYGTTQNPITSKNIDQFKDVISRRHPKAKVIAVDACLGKLKEVGKIKVINGGLAPGKALDRSALSYGDVGVLSIVGEIHENPLEELLTRSAVFISKLAAKTADVVFKLAS